jgi:hypothetical protein
VAASIGLAVMSGATNDGMWRSSWAWAQARHEHSGIDTPVWEQTVIQDP